MRVYCIMYQSGAFRRSYETPLQWILVAVLALSLAVPAGFAAPQQSQQRTATRAASDAAAAKLSSLPPRINPQTAAAADQSQQPQTQDQARLLPTRTRHRRSVKPGSEKDVNSIGNRNVGKGMNLYSLEREIALGKQAAQEVEKSSKLIN